MENSGYNGKITNSGTQTVQAPNKQTRSKPNTYVRGTDLRTGGGKK